MQPQQLKSPNALEQAVSAFTEVRPSLLAIALAELPSATRALLLMAALDDGDRLDEILAASGVMLDAPPTVTSSDAHHGPVPLSD